jgi:lipid-A-disaccharide synthase
VNVKYIALPNLIMDKPVVKELIQNDLTAENISAELKKLLHDKTYRQTILEEYNRLEKQLGGSGASRRIAKHLVEDAAQKN